MPLLSQLIYALRALPGVGPRSAERLAYHLLQTRERSHHLADTLKQTLDTIQQCTRCNTYTETPRCQRCIDSTRDHTLLCITETPLDLLAIEQSGAYKGHYYVLMGKISPLDGIGPAELGLHRLAQRVQEDAIHEVIFALSPTVEGQTTLHCIQSLLEPLNIELSQLAHGIPLGGELALLDGFTISSALQHRAKIV
ncbi:MAG: recombination mediator RecR [Gammaproteobacteria bacterium]|nr:recombination mediator RecR [Gammaproteobacteria bacterium]